MIHCEWNKGKFPRFPLTKLTIIDITDAALQVSGLKKKLGGANIRVSVTLVSDSAIKKLNRTRRGKDKPTDVLSFPLLMWEEGVRYPEIDLGEIYLAPGYIKRKPELQEVSLKEHAEFLVAHGMLHLLGYDHMVPGERREMERLEDALLKKI